MKLLLDQNLSPQLVNRMEDLYPGSIYVQEVSLAQAVDQIVWDYAGDKGLIIITKDVDFSERVSILGFPPKVIWIRRGNCSTNDVENILRQRRDDIQALYDNPETGVLILL